MVSAIPRIRDKEALAASQGQLNDLFDSLDDFLLVVDSQGIILDSNLALAQRLGYTRQELQGRHSRELRPPEFRMQLDAMRPEMGGQIKSFSGPMMARDGTQVPVETKLSLGIWDGKRVVISLGRDLTERQKADEIQASLREKTALLQEIHHRIKNNLQIISSLLSLQATQLESRQERQLFRESQARVLAMALLHEKLYQSPDLSRISFGEYLEALARQILRTYCKGCRQIDLRLEMDALWLNTDAAMPCGLIVNELITNSCKYAFPEGQPGEIYLSARLGPDHTVALLVGDNGMGIPAGLDFRKATTLGLQLVDDMVSQLKGSWTVESSGGTLLRIAFPAGGTEFGKGGVHAARSDSGR
jgi:PAS domain S-box-containing protein